MSAAEVFTVTFLAVLVTVAILVLLWLINQLHGQWLRTEKRLELLEIEVKELKLELKTWNHWGRSLQLRIENLEDKYAENR